jgi:hypothetical protein
MNRAEAKLILEVSRPGDEAPADPQLAEALALAQTDQELGAWLSRERAWDAAVRRELRTVPVPADLKASLLAGAKIVPLPPPESRPSFSAWLTPLIWAMAAAVVLFIGLASYRSLHPSAKNNQLADFARDMIAASPDDARHVDVLNKDFTQVKSWLADHHALADITLPPAIANAPGLMGCRIMTWHGQPVSMLCFMMEGTHHVDLFVTPAATLADAPAPGQPVYASVNQNATAGWRVGDNVYVLSGRVPEDFLRHCLAPAPVAQTRVPLFFGCRVATL